MMWGLCNLLVVYTLIIDSVGDQIFESFCVKPNDRHLRVRTTTILLGHVFLLTDIPCEVLQKQLFHM